MTTCCLVVVSTAAIAENRWRKLPLPPGRAERINSIGLERDTLWAIAQSGLFYWDGTQWNAPTGPALRGGTYAATMIGGGDRPLYCTQAGTKDGTGLLFRLYKNTVVQIGEFPYPSRTNSPGLFVARSGLVLHIKRGEIGIFVDGTWRYADTPISRVNIVEDDRLTCLCFPSSNLMVQITDTGDVTTLPLNLQLPSRPTRSQFVRWGTDRVLVFQRSKPLIQCFDIHTGAPVDVTTLQDELPSLDSGNQYAARDGSVWTLVPDIANSGQRNSRQQSEGLAFVQISADTTDPQVSNRIRIDRKEFSLDLARHRFTETKDGTMWFGLKDAIASFDGESLTQYKHNIGYDVSESIMLEDSHGTIYANNGRVHAFYRASKPPAQLAPPNLARVPSHKLWKFEAELRKPLQSAWMIDGTIVATGARIPLIAIQTGTGDERFRQSWTSDDTPLAFQTIPWMTGRQGQTLEFTTATELVQFDNASGEIRCRQTLSHDRRIAPIRLPDGMLVIPQYRGDEMIVVNNDQSVRWRQRLPGYLMAHPVVHGDRVVLQTRSASYGGQATLCLDLRDGAILWNDRTNAYGAGVAISDDGELMIETDNWMSPKRTEGWVIRRSVEGERLWHYRAAEQRICSPIIDSSTNRVYVMLSHGNIICLNGNDGTTVWEHTLAEGLIDQGGASSYFPAWSPHSLQAGKLLIVDKSMTANIIDARTGKSIARIVLDPDPPVRLPQGPQLIASPWITNGAIVSAFQHGLVAIPLPSGPNRHTHSQETPYTVLASDSLAPGQTCQPPVVQTYSAGSQPCFGPTLHELPLPGRCASSANDLGGRPLAPWLQRLPRKH